MKDEEDDCSSHFYEKVSIQQNGTVHVEEFSPRKKVLLEATNIHYMSQWFGMCQFEKKVPQKVTKN